MLYFDYDKMNVNITYIKLHICYINQPNVIQSYQM